MIDTLTDFLSRIQNELEKTRLIDVAKSQKAEQENGRSSNGQYVINIKLNQVSYKKIYEFSTILRSIGKK